MLKQLLKEKNYPDIMKMNDGSAVTRNNWSARRAEMLELLKTYSYGKTPPPPDMLRCERVAVRENAYAGKVIEETVRIGFRTPRGFTSFPITLYIPKAVTTPPVLIHLAFKPAPDIYIPVEEITDSGYALAVICYQNIVNDRHNGDFSDGFAKYFGTSSEREADEWGKIGMWAYAASRVLDYLLSERPDLDGKHAAVIGHSRLGKTALWCAAQDERFFAAISNNSGYGGAASAKHGHGERVLDFIRAGSWDWFCENFKQFTDERENEKPYDQNFLLALIAPRYLLVGSARADKGADPESEFLTALDASRAWELLGSKGLITPDRMPKPGDIFHDGCIGYHMRSGEHFLSREDWNYYIKFLNSKIK